MREGLDAVGELGEEPALEIHRDVALERDGDSRALDEGEAVRASPEEHLLDVVAMSTRERGGGYDGERGQAMGRGTRREARKAGVEGSAPASPGDGRGLAEIAETSGAERTRVRAASATDARRATAIRRTG